MTMKKSELSRRLASKTPKFWRKVQLVGLLITTAGLAVTSLPVSVPATVAAWATYATVVGGSITAVSQLAESNDKNDKVSIINDLKDLLWNKKN
jgi:uncharacterized membrane protein HdeD (DUF308 family)